METVFSFFPIVKNNIIKQFGCKIHNISGNDSDKINFLKGRIEEDFKTATFHPIPDSFQISINENSPELGITLESFNKISLNNGLTVIFEEIFNKYNASKAPLFLSTMIDNEKIKIDESIKLNPIKIEKFTTGILEYLQDDYLIKYTKDNSFNFGELINDDFLLASKLLFQNGLFVSTIKLLLSSVDTIAYLEHGDVPSNCKKWLDEYVDLNKITISSSELWEFRNSILHMTNSSSRKVLKGEITQLFFYVHEKDIELNFDGKTKYFNLKSLIDLIIQGIYKWINTFQINPEKLKPFFERYDLIISDTRYGKLFIK